MWIKPLFADVFTLRPLRGCVSDSKFIEVLVHVKFVYSENMISEQGIHTMPLSTATFSHIVHPLLSILVYPLCHYDRKDMLLKIDNEEYYEGFYRLALNRSRTKYQLHILTTLGIPESIESSPNLVAEEVRIVSKCIDQSFQELGLVSYMDRVFNITHKLGMSLLVSDVCFFYPHMRC